MMNQQTEQKTDVLLAMDKEKSKIQAVKGIGKDGDLETVNVNKTNQKKFMQVDKHGDLFSNFLSNFTSQLRDPTRFRFFRVDPDQALGFATRVGEDQKKADGSVEKLLSDHEVNAQQPLQKQQNNTPKEATKKEEYLFNPDSIDWATMNNLGLSREYLEKKNLLDPLLRGYKTDELVPVNINLGTVDTRTEARLSLRNGNGGTPKVMIHGVRSEPKLDTLFFGHKFTKEDKENLHKTRNMGRVVNLTNPRNGEIIPSIVSIDRLTNELVALPSSKIKIPDQIKGITLSREQKQTLLDGKPLYLENMISNKNTTFSASVQFNADKKYVEFLFGTRAPKQQTAMEIPKAFRGKKLDEQQYENLKDGKTVYVEGLIDKEGKSYNGYLTFNKDTGKTRFALKDPDKVREQVQPAEAHKTQTAVNSEGKTNEATKNIKAPLDSKQQAPKNDKQQQQQRKEVTPAKTGGRKM